MRTTIAGVVLVVALLFAATASGAPTIVLASPGPSPFAACTADFADVQQQLGSVLYPGSEIEPRSARMLVGCAPWMVR